MHIRMCEIFKVKFSCVWVGNGTDISNYYLIKTILKSNEFALLFLTQPSRSYT